MDYNEFGEWQDPDTPPPCNGVWQIKTGDYINEIFYAQYQNGQWGWGCARLKIVKESPFEWRRDSKFLAWRGKKNA